MRRMKSALMFGTLTLAIIGFFSACDPYATDTASGTGSSGTSGGSSCNTGYCLNNNQCCPASTPDYTYGNHGYAAGCYASCPYVGDCGASTQCF